MKRNSLCHHQNDLSPQQEAEKGCERMHRYLEATRPAFEEALRRSKALGITANGVLAGPSLRVRRETK